MGALSEFRIGQTVELHDGRIATVRFVGAAHFSTGDWVGVELDEASGKNDGSVQGQRYFDCKPGHGMFIRPSVAVITDQPTPKPMVKTAGGGNGLATKPRTQTTTVGGLKRQSILDGAASKRKSMNGGSPTPSSRHATASRGPSSPSKSPAKQLSSSTVSGNAAPRLSSAAPGPKPGPAAPKPRNSIAGRPSITPSSTSLAPRSSRLSIAGTLGGGGGGTTNTRGRPAAPAIRGPGTRMSTLQNGTRRPSSISENSQASAQSGPKSPVESQRSQLLSPNSSEAIEYSSQHILSPPLSRASTTSRTLLSPRIELSPERTSPVDSKRAPSASLGSNREIEDLKIKLRLMEKKRMEDRDKLKQMEKIQGDRDKFEGIIQKLQAKYQPQQQEIAQLKKQLREAETNAEAKENTQADNDTAIEMATLDREMAEETAESLKAELDALRQSHEELELEAEILREENAELGKEMSPEERTSQGWMQMERSNERLREALRRLRDVTQEQEAGLKQQVKELEKDVQEIESIRTQLQSTQEKLRQSDEVVEDLRQQLDTALGAEEMIEELAEKNMSLTDQLDDFRAAIEDLENLKELNDELEINHMETEKQLQDEIDYQEVILMDQTKKSAVKDETIDDLEYTVSRFRELVTNLQSDLEDMRASQQITEAEASELTNRSRAMMDLNMRLQASASKSQIKAIDLDLRRLEAQESAEHLAIVQHFLPHSFNNERSSVHALLRFKRIGFKANLIHGVFKEKVNGQAPAGLEDETFIGFEILDKLTWVSTMCNRFIKFIQTCSLEAFKNLEGALHDLEPVERAFNSWIDALKRDELKEQHCATELHRSIALMAHLAEVHFGEGLTQHAEDVHTRSLLIQSNLENGAAALSYIKSVAQSKVPAPSDDEEEIHQAHDFLSKIDTLISQLRSAKVVSSKAVHQLEELLSRSLTLDPSTLTNIEQTQSSVSDLVSTIRDGGTSLFTLLHQEGRTSSLTYPEIADVISLASSSFSSGLSSKIHITASQIQSFFTLTTTLSQTVEYPDSRHNPLPWELLAHKLRAETTTSAAHEEEVGRLKDELHERNTILAIRNKLIEEMSVNVEVLEKRVGDSGSRREKVRELEGVVESARSKESELIRRLGRLQQDLQAAEASREALRSQVLQIGAQSQAQSPSLTRAGEPVATSLQVQEEITRLKGEISNLQSTIRYLRISSHKATLDSSYSFLSAPLLPQPTIPPKAQLAYEARDVLKTMLELVTRDENQVVQVKPRAKEDRLRWRPVKESPRWQLGRQKEAWEAWREWRDDVGQKGLRLRTEEERRRRVLEKKGEVLARVTFGSVDMEGKDKVREVRIANPGEWEELEEDLGIA